MLALKSSSHGIVLPRQNDDGSYHIQYTSGRDEVDGNLFFAATRQETKPSDMEGWLMKKREGLLHTEWIRRYCVLHGPVIYIFENENSPEIYDYMYIQDGGLHLSCRKFPCNNNKHFVFRLNCIGGQWQRFFEAPNEVEYKKWVKKLELSINGDFGKVEEVPTDSEDVI